MRKKRILILGGGYGGLKTAIRLQKRNADAEITLVSKHNYHYQTTLLHKIAVGTLGEKKARVFYRSILKDVCFIKDKVLEIFPKERRVQGKFGCYSYDILVIALGFKPEYFGVEGAREHTFKLASLNSALSLSRHIERKFKDFHIQENPADLSFIVCGAGFTSIEFVAELAHDVDRFSLVYGVPREKVKMYCIGRSESILPVFPSDLSQKAYAKLTKLGVTFCTNANVVCCEKGGVIIQQNGEEKKIVGHTILWGAGVKGNDEVVYHDMQPQKGKLKVNDRLQSTEFDNVYVVGDSAIHATKEVIFVPTAQLATQMGDYVGNLLADELEGKEVKKGFRFNNRGSVCSIGHLDGVGVIFGRKISGEFSAFMKNTIENRWLYGIGGLKMVFKKGQFRYRSSD